MQPKITKNKSLIKTPFNFSIRSYEVSDRLFTQTAQRHLSYIRIKSCSVVINVFIDNYIT